MSIFALLFLAAFLTGVFAAVDAAVRPQRIWDAAMVSLTKWGWVLILALAAVFLLLSPINLIGLAGLAAVILYLVDVRPKLREVSARSRRRRT